jgi:hypothetical protein
VTTDEAKDRIRAVMKLRSEDAERERLGFRKKPRRYGRTEHEEQAIVVKWLTAHGISFTAVPNAGRRSYRQASMLRAEGMQKGYPDLDIKTPPPKRPDARGVVIEMKKLHGGALTVEQFNWLRKLEADGYLTHVAQGANDAIAWLQGLGYGAER